MVSRKNQGSRPPPPPPMKHIVPKLRARTPEEIQYYKNMEKRLKAINNNLRTQGSEGLKKIEQLYHGGRKRTRRARRTHRRRTHRR